MDMQRVPEQYELITAFYQKNRMEMIHFASLRLPYSDDAEDLVQDTFVRLLEYGETIDATTIKSFVYTVLKNLINDRLRAHLSHERITYYLYTQMELSSCAVDHAVERNELWSVVGDGIKTLTPACTRIYKMTFYEGLSTREIAMRLSISKRTADTQLTVARKKIREYVTKTMLLAV